jgi:UDP-2,4-diacetamido-2,4,6-trideoxy-beta-L-altropyranose hydrolase
MSRTKIIFRADSGPGIGLGHFVRTLALADMLRSDFHCTYATRQPTAWQKGEIENVCHDWLGLPGDEGHFDVFLKHLHGDEIVVLDNYHFETDYQRAIREKSCKLVCIDDIHDKHFVADVVINHAAGVKSTAYSVEPYTKLLLGYSYAMLRREFLAEQASEERKRYSVLVIMGGADPKNITRAVVQAACSRQWDLPVAVVRAVNPTPMDCAVGLENVKIFEWPVAKTIARLMREAIIAVLPASTVAVEACAIRLPFVAGYFVENQREIHEGLREYRLAMSVGDFTDMAVDRMAAAITSLMTDDHMQREMVRNQQTHLDRKSPSRLLGAFRDLCH